MKKILYIVPILVFAMVALTQDAKAQQTGNASNGITQAAAGAVVNNAVVGATANTGNDAAGGAGATITVTAPVVAPAATASTPAGAPEVPGISPIADGGFPPPPTVTSGLVPSGTVSFSAGAFMPGETISFTLTGENASGATLA